MHPLLTQIQQHLIKNKTRHETFAKLAEATLYEYADKINEFIGDDFSWLESHINELPKQLYELNTFSDLPVTLIYDKEHGFCIDVYVWRSQDTSIHDHGFSGAFMVARGSSLNTNYRFNVETAIAENKVHLGELDVKENQYLRKNHIVRIDVGESFIHSVIHLEKPTLSFVIRNFSGQAQYQYHSYLRFESGEQTYTKSKMNQLLNYYISYEPNKDLAPFFMGMPLTHFLRYLYFYLAGSTKNYSRIMELIKQYGEVNDFPYSDTLMKSLEKDAWTEQGVIWSNLDSEEDLLVGALLQRAKSFSDMQNILIQSNPKFKNHEEVFLTLKKVFANKNIKLNIPDFGLDLLSIQSKQERNITDDQLLGLLSKQGWGDEVFQKREEIIKLNQKLKELPFTKTFYPIN